MLTFYGFQEHGPVEVDRNTDVLPEKINWIDALNPTADEMSFLKRVLGVNVPTRDDLVEIESSSRLSMSGKTLLMSVPATVKDANNYPKGTPIGFVASKERLATIRFDHLPSFETLAHNICAKGDLAEGGFGATVTVLEVMIDHIADLLEHLGHEMDEMSRSIFLEGLVGGKDHRPHHANRVLSRLLKKVGRTGDIVSRISESLLGLSRIAPYVTTKAQGDLSADLKSRLETVSLDARSLHEFQEHLANKTQFLLDSLLGMANIEQNNVFRVLTVVSVVGIPPTFFASMYGMNFKGMPEYDWAYGYPYGLTLIILSALIPAIWFKVKGWW